MADKKESQKNTADPGSDSWWKKILRAMGVADPVIDAGLLAGIGTLLYKLSSQRGGGNLFGSILGSGSAGSVDPDLNDEANFDCLITLLAAGGAEGSTCKEYIKGIHDALREKNVKYAEQFRNYFFSGSGIKLETLMQEMQNLLGAVKRNSRYAWARLSHSHLFPLQRAIELCKEVEEEVRKIAPPTTTVANGKAAARQACAIIAQRMIDDGRLPGTALIRSEEQWDKSIAWINAKLQGWNAQKDAEKIALARAESQMSPTRQKWSQASPWKWMGVTVGVILLLIVIISISAPPKIKVETPSAVEMIQQSTAGEKVNHWWDFIPTDQ